MGWNKEKLSMITVGIWGGAKWYGKVVQSGIEIVSGLGLLLTKYSGENRFPDSICSGGTASAAPSEQIRVKLLCAKQLSVKGIHP